MANNDIVAVDPSTIANLQTREIDQQISTARRYPRDEIAFSKKLAHFVTADEDTAQDCTYCLPRAGKEITGPSVRFAEIAGPLWGNSRYGAMLIEEGREFLTARAFFFDLQSNTAISLDLQRRIMTSEYTKSNGEHVPARRYNIDMIGTTAQAAMKIALRNVILTGIGPFWKPAYAKSVAIITGSFETIGARRSAALEHYKRMGVPEQLVLELLGVRRVEDIEGNHMLTLRGTLMAIREGETTAERVFGALPSQKAPAAKSDLAGKIAQAKATTAQASAAAAAKPAPTEPAKTEPAKPKVYPLAAYIAACDAATDLEMLEGAALYHQKMLSALTIEDAEKANAAAERARVRLTPVGEETEQEEVEPESETTLEETDSSATDGDDAEAVIVSNFIEALGQCRTQAGVEEVQNDFVDDMGQLSDDAVAKCKAAYIETLGRLSAPNETAAPESSQIWLKAEDIPGVSRGEWKPNDVKFFSNAIGAYANTTNHATFREALDSFIEIVGFKRDEAVKAIYREIQQQHAKRLGVDLEPPKVSSRSKL